MKTINVASFNELDKAEELKRRLAEEGINAEVYDESKLQNLWFFSKSYAGEKVRVDEKDFDRAKAILKGLDAREDVLHDAVKCPKCGSSRVEYPQFTRKFITTSLIEIFSLSVTEKQFFCQDCQNTWAPEPDEPRPETDVLGWPKKDA